MDQNIGSGISNVKDEHKITDIEERKSDTNQEDKQMFKVSRRKGIFFLKQKKSLINIF